MLSDTGSSKADSSPTIRQRVMRACDRCRAKKSKCDGASPCKRCEIHKEVCVFRLPSKPNNKIYPKGYVEMLEFEQRVLISALQKLYLQSLNGEKWSGPEVQIMPNGMPSTHDILNSLGALKAKQEESQTTTQPDFEVDYNTLLQTMVSTETIGVQGPDSVQAAYSVQTTSVQYPVEAPHTDEQKIYTGFRDFNMAIKATYIDNQYSHQIRAGPFTQSEISVSAFPPQTDARYQVSWQVDGFDLSTYMDFNVDDQHMSNLYM